MKTLTEFSQVALRRAADAHKTAVAAGLEGDALAEALQTQLGIPAERVPRVIEAVEIVGDTLESLRLVRVFQGEAGPQGAITKGEFHYVVNRAPTPKKGLSAPRGNERPGRDQGKGGDKRGGGGDRPRAEKPRGLGALKAGGNKDDGAGRSERVNFAEIPRAGMGWQWTRAPRDPNDTRPDRPRKGPPGRRPDGRGPGRPGGGGNGPGAGARGPRPQAAAPSPTVSSAPAAAAPTTTQD